MTLCRSRATRSYYRGSGSARSVSGGARDLQQMEGQLHDTYAWIQEVTWSVSRLR